MIIVAILKHVAGKSADYGAALDYLKYEHDEVLKRPLLDANGNWVLRRDILLEGINCEPELFDVECEMLNAQYHKNQNYDEIKTHHYLISFDPADKDECGLTGEQAQAIGMEYVKANFPGHQALVCTHMDGHNGSGNIHVHIVINSLRKLNVPQQPFMERPIDCKAGYKHHLTKDYLKHLQQSLMNICLRENLNQVDLLSPSVNKITQQEYYAKQRGQINLDKLNAELIAEGFTPMKTKFQTEKDKLRDSITAAAKKAKSFEEFSRLLQLKLAQFTFLQRTSSNTLPLLLLDDIFDKLDAQRVEAIVKLVAGDHFGQIFITDTNRDHLDKILQNMQGDHTIFYVENGEIIK